ncbi:MAG: AAA family ATPase [Bacilli bacterium]|nr:AAA family ATPase [Bacilli bacterium]
MYLKEISCNGFKSFADKITINLDGKITAIVGPNGSGKSNIVDAVRWVLGEQSVKSLRGNSSMTDIIFSGSKSRNPLNVASVSLIFDNQDHYLDIPYNEVSIKRRVYRSGESEYFLNGEKCRLKDITDLLIDSASSKESFNIISQGEISHILSNSPEERRLIIENAAGVLKYKKRKEEAIKKLDRTESNIERVLDIINELELQLTPLEEQAKKAEEYLDAKEKLENVEVALTTEEIDKINYENISSKKRIEELNNEILNLNLKNNNSDMSLSNNKLGLLKLEKEIKEKNERLLLLTSKEEKLNGEKELLKERSKYDASDSKVHNNIASLKEDLLQNDNSIKLIVKDIELLNIEKNKLNDEINKETLELNNIASRKEHLVTDLNNKKREDYDISNRINSLTSYIESYASTPNSVKSILNNPRLSHVHGTLASLIECESANLKALEVSISSTKNFVIVDNEQDAKECIAYLKDNNLGRATFFPMSVIKPKGIDIDTLNIIKRMDGYIGILSDLVKYDSKYQNIIKNQLGNVIVAVDIDKANKISSEIHRAYKVVSLDGDVIHVGGTITGGSLNLTKSLITEKNELENLKRRKKEIDELITSIDENLKTHEEKIEKLNYELGELKRNLIGLKETTIVKENLISELTERKNDIEKELKTLDNVLDNNISSEEEKIMKEYYEVSLEKDNLIKEIKYKEKEKDELSNKILEEEATNKLNNSNISKLEKELKDLEIKVSKYEMKLDNYLELLNQEYQLTYEKAKASYTLEISTDEARSEVLKYRNIIKNIGMVNIDAIENYKNISERYNFLTTQKDDLTNAKDTLIEIITEMDEVMKEEFTKTFEKVKVEFKKVFKELFNGGEADLLLTDKNNILETGVDILACPPGKKLKAITLLSGGEMTLTAISLLFAILNVRSVPFCIFDEVEAALDEANVDNFGKYLDHYKDKTQFLIITHKKKTMEYADTLYGITMQESGVSKLVSVKLSEINK